MIETIIVALLPILVTLMLGFFAGWERNFNQDQAGVLTRMVMLYALPMTLFAGILGTPLDLVTKNVAVFVWITIGMVGGQIVVFLAAFFIFRSSAKLAALSALQNSAPHKNVNCTRH